MRTPRITRGLVLVAATLSPLLALAPLGPGTAAASATAAPNDAAGVVYPVTSFMDWAQNPMSDFTNRQLGQYALNQGLADAQSAVLHQFPTELSQGLVGPAAAEAFSEQMAANLIHLRPQVAGVDMTDQANPAFMPDFNHNGVYGDPGDDVAMQGHSTANGYFLYPCLSDTGVTTYETTNGTCVAPGTPGVTFKEGLAQQESIINARGLKLAATLWLPAAALRAGCPAAGADPTACVPTASSVNRAAHGRGGHMRRLPTVVIAEGIASAQDSYFWLAMTLARTGDIVLTYDPAGQSGSEGSVTDLFTPSVPNCTFGGACRDLEDVMRWMVGQPITPVLNLSTTTPLVAANGPTPPSAAISNPAYQPAGANVVDPVAGEIDQSRLAVVGHSMGAISLLNYLWFQGHGTAGADGNPLPPLATGIALSGAAATTAVVPLQFQTSDDDGSPTLIGPGVGGVALGVSGDGIGYANMKPEYDQLRTTGPGTSALSMIVLEGGVHTDFIDTPYVPRTSWALAVSAHYATAWLGCFLKGQNWACLSAVKAIPHLSSSFASEVAPSGGPLPHPSHCITVPTTASLNDSPSQLLNAEQGHPSYTCQP
jgi:hypothetical protein